MLSPRFTSDSTRAATGFVVSDRFKRAMVWLVSTTVGSFTGLMLYGRIAYPDGFASACASVCAIVLCADAVAIVGAPWFFADL